MNVCFLHHISFPFFTRLSLDRTKKINKRTTPAQSTLTTMFQLYFICRCTQQVATRRPLYKNPQLDHQQTLISTQMNWFSLKRAFTQRPTSQSIAPQFFPPLVQPLTTVVGRLGLNSACSSPSS